MEWTVCCGGTQPRQRRGPITTNITYIPLSPEVENRCKILKILLFGLIRLAKRSRVDGIAKVLGQGLREMVQVPGSNRLNPFVDEFDLWGIGAFRVGHWGGAIGGGLPGDRKLGPQVAGLYFA